MKTKTLIIGVLLLGLVLIPTTSAKDRPAGGRDGFHRDLAGQVGKRLGLTDEQKEQIKGLLKSGKAEAKTAQKAVPEAMKALEEAAKSGDKGDIKSASKALAEALTTKIVQRAETAKSVRAVLTDEQASKLDEMKAKAKEHLEKLKKGRAAGIGRGHHRGGPRMQAFGGGRHHRGGFGRGARMMGHRGGPRAQAFGGRPGMGGFGRGPRMQAFGRGHGRPMGGFGQRPRMMGFGGGPRMQAFGGGRHPMGGFGRGPRMMGFGRGQGCPMGGFGGGPGMGRQHGKPPIPCPQK